MEKSKNVSKMSLAALKAWTTRRAHAAASSKKESKNEKKNEGKKEVKKTIGRTVKEMLKQERVKDVSTSLKADEKREMMALNGTDMEQLAKETQKRMDRKEAFETAKNGYQDKKAVSVGKIIRKAKIERFNGGVKVSGVQ